MQIESKLPNVGVTIFTVMTNLANEHGAHNLSQGFPEFDTPPELVSCVEKYMRSGYNQYAPMQGVPLLRQRIAEKTEKIYGAQIDHETEITVTTGATEALFAAITAAVHPGDEVIVIEPAYDSYVPAIVLNAARPVYITMKHPDYTIDWNEVADAVTENTRLIILNSPHNPTGTVLMEEDISALREIVTKNSMMIISDEVYEHIIFDGLTHQSMLRHPDLAARSFVISSFGKTYHTTGWKVGYCIAPAAMTKALQQVHQFLTFAVNTPIQHAFAEFMVRKDAFMGLADFYQQKRDLFLSMIKESRFRPLACRGTFFQLLDYSPISGQPELEFARWLTSEHGVAAIPPSSLYHQADDHHVLRFCFAKKDDTIERAADLLCQV
jgi:methionine aminotransferase